MRFLRPVAHFTFGMDEPRQFSAACLGYLPFIPEQKGAPPPTTHRASTVLEAAEGAMNRWVCDCNDGAAVAASRQLTSPEDPMVNGFVLFIPDYQENHKRRN